MPPRNTLWTCQLTPVPGTTPVQRHTALRSFDLSTGAPKIRWNLPGDNSTCNDFAIGPDKALYITDTANSKIYKLPAGASTAELFLEHRALYGIDGITFLDGTLYVNNVFSNNLYRIPVDAAGKAGTACRYLDGPAGERAGWHARRQRQAARRREWQRQDFRHHRQWRQGQRHRDQGRTQHTDRGRACGRHDLDRRARRRQGRLDPDAEVIGQSASRNQRYQLTKRKRERLHAGIEEFNLESPVLDCSLPG